MKNPKVKIGIKLVVVSLLLVLATKLNTIFNPMVTADMAVKQLEDSDAVYAMFKGTPFIVNLITGGTWGVITFLIFRKELSALTKKLFKGDK